MLNPQFESTNVDHLHSQSKNSSQMDARLADKIESLICSNNNTVLKIVESSRFNSSMSSSSTQIHEQ